MVRMKKYVALPDAKHDAWSVTKNTVSLETESSTPPYFSCNYTCMINCPSYTLLALAYTVCPSYTLLISLMAQHDTKQARLGGLAVVLLLLGTDSKSGWVARTWA